MAVPQKILFLRGTTARSLTYTGQLGEITIDTDYDAIRVHDGVTPGGWLQLGQSSLNAVNTIVAAHSSNISAIFGSLDSLSTATSNLQSADGVIIARINTLSANLGVQVNAISGLRTDVNNHTGQISLLNSQINTWETSLATQVNTLQAEIDSINATDSSQAAQLSSHTASLSTLFGNALAQGTQINLLWANAATQQNQISTLNSGLATTNDNLNSAVASINSNLSTAVNSTNANLASTTATLNGTIVTANTAMKNYVDAINTALTANAVAQNSQIQTVNTALTTQVGVINSAIAQTNANVISANSAIKSYADHKFAPLINPVFPGDVNIYGSIYVNGNTTVVGTNNVSLNDSIIYLASDNPGNTVDIGFLGHFDNGTYQHTGLIRSAVDGQWKLFSNVAAETTNNVDLTDAVYDPIRVGAIQSPTVDDIYSNLASQTTNIVNTNTALTTANSAMKSYVDSADSHLSARIDAANVSASSANVSLKSYIDTLLSATNTAWQANAASQENEVSGLRASITAANVNIANNSSSITLLNANVTAANAQIHTLQTQVYTNSNVAAYLPTYAGTVTAANVTTANGIFWSNGAPFSPGGFPSRTTVSVTTPTLATGANANVTITGFKGYALYSVSTSANAWVSVYSSVAARSADYTRSQSTDPTPGAGVLAEVITTGNTTQYFTPAIVGFSTESPANGNIQLKVTNTGNGVTSITVGLTILQMEN